MRYQFLIIFDLVGIHLASFKYVREHCHSLKHKWDSFHQFLHRFNRSDKFGSTDEVKLLERPCRKSVGWLAGWLVGWVALILFPALLVRLKGLAPGTVFWENFKLFQASIFTSILSTFGNPLGFIFGPFSDILASFSDTFRNFDFASIFERNFHRCS